MAGITPGTVGTVEAAEMAMTPELETEFRTDSLKVDCINYTRLTNKLGGVIALFTQRRL